MATAEVAEYEQGTKDLGDKIVGLTLLEARKLADYLENVYGIKPAAGAAPARPESARPEAMRGAPGVAQRIAGGRLREAIRRGF